VGGRSGEGAAAAALVLIATDAATGSGTSAAEAGRRPAPVRPAPLRFAPPRRLCGVLYFTQLYCKGVFIGSVHFFCSFRRRRRRCCRCRRRRCRRRRVIPLQTI
ncbi:unnamed protein product, partial [Laminaria digitata]